MATQVNPDFVMSRMEWFRDLKLIYNQLLPEEDILTPLDKNLLINELKNKALKLDLKSPEQYNERSKVQAFSLEEIFDHINRLNKQVNFDQLIDSLIYLSIDKKKKEKIGMTENTESTYKAIKIVEISEMRSGETNTQAAKPGPVKVNRDIGQVNKRECLIKQETLNKNFPECKLSDYPELGNYECLKYLYLAGNSLSHTSFSFPQSLIALNLSCNRLNELRFTQEMKNLEMLNVADNKIERVLNINKIQELKEIMIGNNCMTSVNLFCHLSHLQILDCSSNYIKSFEDIAGLVISKKLGVLKLKGNPICLKEGYKAVVISLLPRIQKLDPVNIHELSSFRGLDPSAFASGKNSSEKIEKKTAKKVIENKEKSVTPLYKQSLSYSPMITKQKEKTRPAVQNPSVRIKRSNSQTKTSNLKSGDSANSRFSTASQEDNAKYFDIFSGGVIDLADRRIQGSMEGLKMKHNISVVSSGNIQGACKKVYGNPVAAMMIGPPAVGQGKRMTRTPASYSLDLTNSKKE